MIVEGGIFGSYTNCFQCVAHSLIIVVFYSLEPNQFCRHSILTVLNYFLNIVSVMMLICNAVRSRFIFEIMATVWMYTIQAGPGQNNKNMPNKFETQFGSYRCHN